MPRRSVWCTFTEGTYLDNPDMSSFSQTGLQFSVGFFNSQLAMSWRIPMRSFTRAVVVTRWAENRRNAANVRVPNTILVERDPASVHSQARIFGCASALRGSGARMLETQLLRRTDICPEFSGGQQRVCFSWNFCVRVSDGLHDHRSCIGSTNCRSACMATGIFASTSFLPTGFNVEFAMT